MKEKRRNSTEKHGTLINWSLRLKK